MLEKCEEKVLYKFRKAVAEIPSFYSASNPGKSSKNTNTDRNAWRHSRKISARILETNFKKVTRKKSRNVFKINPRPNFGCNLRINSD